MVFVIYIGEKKIEYKKKFNYLTFIFGKPSCKGKSSNTKLVESFIHAYNKNLIFIIKNIIFILIIYQF